MFHTIRSTSADRSHCFGRAWNVIALAMALAIWPKPLQAAELKVTAIPTVFEPNRGQAPAEFRYLSRGSGYRLYFSDSGFVFRWSTPGKRLDAVRIDFLAASRNVSLEGDTPTEGRSNYLIGADAGKWITDVPHFTGVRYRSIYPNVDALFYAHGRELEYDLVVSPGADPRQIRFRVSGAKRVRVNAAGDLVLETASGAILQRRPAIYQRRNGERAAVDGRYRLLRGGIVSFEVAEYDRDLPLTIDPVLSYATFLGGSSYDAIAAVATDGSGAVYVAGKTSSLDLATTSGSYRQSSPGGGQDAFVAKLNSSGSAVVYATYIGGSNFDAANAIAVDASGNVYVAGETNSTNFPVTVGALQSAGGGYPASLDAFVAKLDAAGSALIYSTYLGGLGDDSVKAIAVDAGGNAFIGGYTWATDFPVSPNAYRMIAPTGKNGFVAKLNPTGSASFFSTYLGGSGDDAVTAIALESATGSLYVTGETGSTDFPTTAGVTQRANAGVLDAFVTKFLPDGTGLAYSSYLGGNGADSATGIAVDVAGNAYLCGSTSSPNFPTAAGAYEKAMNGAGTAFVTKLNATASALAYSTFLGSGNDTATAILVNGAGEATVAGYTYSNYFPVRSDAFQYSISSGSDAFLTRLNAAGSDLLYSTLIGGSGDDHAWALAADSNGNLYVAGDTGSKDFPATNGAAQVQMSGGPDAFLAKFDFATPATASLFASGALLNFQSYVTATGNSRPAAQSVSVATTGSPVTFRPVISTTGGGDWLSITGSATTPSVLTVQADPTGLPVGFYQGKVSITSPGVAGGHTSVNASLSVQRPFLLLNPASLTFDYTPGGAAPSDQTVSVYTNSGAPVAFSSVTTTAGWLHVTPTSGAAPATLTISVQPAGLPNGTYSGFAYINAPLADLGSQTAISVTLRVGPQLLVTPLTSYFNSYTIGGTPPTPSQWGVNSSGAALSFTASAASSGWLSVTPASGTTGGTVLVSMDPTGLAPGSYSGTVTITAPGSVTGSVSTPVYLSVVRPTINVYPSPLTIQAASGSSTPVSTTLSVAGPPSPSLNFTLSTGSTSWLSVGATSGSTGQLNAAISVKADPTGLADGNYSGTITVTSASAANSPVAAPVTFKIGPMLSLSSSYVGFAAVPGAGAPAPQAILVSAGAQTIPFTTAVSTISGGNWLSVNSGSGTTPATLTVNVDPAGLAAGYYTGMIQVSSTQALNGPFTVTVSLTVGPLLAVTLSGGGFTQAPGGAAPAPQTFSISTGASMLPYSVEVVTGSNWLTVNPVSGTTPAIVTMSANGGALPPGNYPGLIVITAPGASNASQMLNVMLTVSQSMSVTPAVLVFTGLSPAPAPMTVTASTPLTSVTASAVSTGWLSVVPGSGGAGSFVVSANPAGMAAGTYLGAISFSAAGVSNSPVTAQVQLNVPATTLLTPGNGATGLVLAPTLTWNPAGGASSYDVYLGTSTTPALAATVSTISYSPGTLIPDTTYYWRVVAKGAAASLSSPTWSFHTQTTGASLSVSPSAGGASVQTFSATAVHPAGYTNLAWIEMLLAVAPDGGGQPYCFVHYDVTGRMFWLYGEGGFFLGPVAPGSQSNSLQNSFCALNTLGSIALGSGTGLTVNASLTFKGAGIRNIYLRSLDRSGVDSGWVQRGAFTLTQAGSQPMIASPSSGNGATQTFTLTYPDPPGFAGAPFGWAQFLVAAASNGGGQPFCFVHYDRGGNGLWMYSSDVGYFLGPVAPGTSSTLLSSSACSVNTGSATIANTNTGSLVVTVPITLKGPMSGARQLYQRTLDVLNRDSGWQQSGAWMVP